VAPGADLERVVLRCEGMEAFDVLDGEQFSLHAALGSLIQAPAVSWQIQSDGSTQPVTATWVQHGPDRLGLVVEDRDATLPLVIDPELLWSTYLGGTSGDGFSSIGWDAHGNVLAAGTTGGYGFPQTPGSYQHASTVGENAFVVKFRGSDGTLLYSSLFSGGSGEEDPYALAVSLTRIEWKPLRSSWRVSSRLPGGMRRSTSWLAALSMSSLRRVAARVSAGMRRVLASRRPWKRASVAESPKETITRERVTHSRIPCNRAARLCPGRGVQTSSADPRGV